MRLAFTAVAGLGYVEVVDGEVAPVATSLEDQTISSLSAPPDAPWLSVRVEGGHLYGSYVEDVPGEPQLITAAPVPATAVTFGASFSATHERVDFLTHDQETGYSLWFSALDGGVVAAPTQVLGSSPSQGIREVSFGSQWIALELGPQAPSNPGEIYLLPAADPHPDNLVQLTNLDDPAFSVLRQTPSGNHVLFEAYSYVDSDYEWVLHRVPTTGAMPAVAELVHDAMESSALSGFRPGSDDFVYLLRDDLDLAYSAGDLYFVAEDGAGDFLPPVLINAVADRTAVFEERYFASDGEALIFEAREGGPTRQVFYVTLDDGFPSAPQLVSNADGGNIWYARFDASNEWVYFVQEHLAQGPQLYRSRVASGTPEPAQRVNPDDLETDYTYLAGFSPDGTKAVYGTSVDSVTNLWLVDVAGDVPGESALLHGELSQTPSPPLAWSIDSRHVAYRLDPGGLENQSIALTDTVDGVGTYVEIAELARVYGTQYVELSSTAALPR